MVRTNPPWNDATAWTQDKFIFVGHVTCVVFFNQPLPSVSNAQEDAQVAKAWLEATQTWVTKARKGLESKRVSTASSGTSKQEKMGSQTRANAKRWFTNGSSRMQPMSGPMTKEQRIVGTALGGNQTHHTKDSFKANKFIKFMGLHRPTKEWLLQAHMQTRS